MATISIKNLDVTYLIKKTPIPAVKHFSCEFKDGSINVILGSSGSGKTSVLRAISNVLDYDGDILFNGVDSKSINTKERCLSYVSQEFALYPHLTVFDNLAYPLKNMRMDYDDINKRIIECAREFEILHLLTRLPKQISIGQQQRVAIARALIKKPDIVLFDEPLSNVDPLLKSELRYFIKKIVKKNKATAVWVTHDFYDATALADNIIIMDEGQIIFSGNADKLESCTDKRVLDYLEVLKKNEI